MLISRRLFVTAASYVDRASTAANAAGLPQRHQYAAMAAQAAMAARPHAVDELRGIYHAATVVPTIPGLDLAADVLRAAQLPVHSDDPVVTVAGGSHRVLAALRLAATELDATIDPEPEARLVTAGDAWPARPVPESTLHLDAGGALVLSNQRGPLQLVAIVTETDLELARLIQTGGDPQLINERAEHLLFKLAVSAMEESNVAGSQDEIDHPYLDQYFDHLVGPYLPDARGHALLRHSLGVRANDVELPDTTETGDSASNPLNVIRHLAAIVKHPRDLWRNATVLAVSDWDTGTASAAVFRVHH